MELTLEQLKIIAYWAFVKEGEFGLKEDEEELASQIYDFLQYKRMEK